MASQTRVPCRTLVDITNFGFLDASQESQDLPDGSQIELPIWAATAMSTRNRGFVSVRMPKYFGDKYRDVLKADPVVVDLNKMGPQYYQAGLQLCTLPSDDGGQVSETLPEVLQRRLIGMFDAYSLNRDMKSTDDCTSNNVGNTLRYHYMDPLETKIFNDSKHASEELDSWLRN